MDHFACMKLRLERFTTDQVYQSSWRINSTKAKTYGDISQAYLQNKI